MTGIDAVARIAQASAVRPSSRQLAWQRMEFYGFIHFGMNTMTDLEWGHGHESRDLFDPATVDADQWVASLRDAGMTGVILTCKHHDGFCLWPSAHTAHSVAHSPWRGGAGDLVAEVAAACRRHGLQFGIYLSPWDRTEASYGSGAAYDDYFVAQLTELLTGYGPVFCVWLDGACGEGPNGIRQVYDWDRYFAVIRALQPDAVISVCGPDVRWCGNEAGHTRPDEWSVVPASLRSAERTASLSQQTDDPAFARLVRSDQDDLGSREVVLSSAEELVWYPAEVNTSIRPGWFHHPAEDDAVRSPAELFEIYRRSVGGNSCFLLNVPPTRDGLVHDADAAALRELGALIAELAERDVAGEAVVTANGESATLPAVGRVLEVTGGTRIRLEWPDEVEIDAVVLGEDIESGQQIDGFSVSASAGGPAGAPALLARGHAVGHRRILDLPLRKVRVVEIEIEGARGPAGISRLSVLSPSRRRGAAPA